jgi:uncharacterized protein
MYTQADINELATKLTLSASSPAKVMLFGSYARGEATEGSDVDFLVLEKNIFDKDEEYFKLFTAVRSANVDLILMREDDYIARTNSVGSLPYRIAREGVTLYGA